MAHSPTSVDDEVAMVEQFSDSPFDDSPAALWRQYDALIFDLDGVVYTGAQPVCHAVDVLAFLSTHSAPVWFATNNASRTASQVAEHLSAMGVAVSADQVITSSAACASYISTSLPQVQKIRVIGADGILPLLAELGIEVFAGKQDPTVVCEVVVQGHSTKTDWQDLAAGFHSIVGGAAWIATNSDLTIPLEYGLAPGNGALVAALAAALGCEPDVVIGKPHTPMFSFTQQRTAAYNPLIIGDRRDTDIAWANDHGCASMLVDTGVDRISDAVTSSRYQSTYLASDLRSLLLDPAQSQ